MKKFVSITLMITIALIASPHCMALLLIGTTGDYPPLTYYDHNTRQFTGFEIDMAKSLGNYLHQPIKFIKTSWPSMASDLTAGKFVIAMSGIDATPKRQQQFLLSLPVIANGKVPLVRCTDSKRYDTIKKINQPQVRVIENIGGTNSQFAKQYLPRASLIIIKNNQQTFSYLLNNKADVMITDSIEGVYQQKRHRILCAVNPRRPFTKRYKVYLVSKSNQPLLKQINQWLVELKQSGQLQQLIQKYNITNLE